MEKEQILKQIYKLASEILKPTEEGRKTEKEFVAEREKFLEQVGEKYRNELEKVTDLAIAIGTQREEQLFYEGYKAAETLLMNNKK